MNFRELIMRKTAKKYILLSLLALTFVFYIISFYPFSGLPMPWSKVSFEAYERLNYRNLSQLAGLVEYVNNRNEKFVLSWETLKKAALEKNFEFYEDIALELPKKERFLLYDKPKGTLQIVISGNTRDHCGLVWGVTKNGQIIKY